MRRKLLFLLLGFIPVFAFAGYISGNELLSDLESADPSNNLKAKGFIFGVADTGELMREIESVQSLSTDPKSLAPPRFKTDYFCIPDDVIGRQLFDVVKTKLITSPTNRQWSAAILVRLAFIEAWPCAYNPLPQKK